MCTHRLGIAGGLHRWLCRWCSLLAAEAVARSPRQRLQNHSQQTPAHPLSEAVKANRARGKALWQVGQHQPGAQKPEDAVEHQEISNRLRIGIGVLILLSLFCNGCTLLQVPARFAWDAAEKAHREQRNARQKELIKEPVDKRIGYQSSPVTVPQFGELRLQVFPLNANDRRGMEPFVICLAARWTTHDPEEKAQTLSIDAKTISLILPDGSAIKPSGYAVEAICPYPEYSSSSTRTLAFGEINLGEPLVWKRSPLLVWWGFPDLALRFDVVTPGAEQKFSLRLGPLALDGVPQEVPTIEFTSYYGAILRIR